MELVLLLEVEENIALIYDPENKKELKITLNTEQANYYNDILQENSENEVVVFYDPTNNTLNLISHEKEIG